MASKRKKPPLFRPSPLGDRQGKYDRSLEASFWLMITLKVLQGTDLPGHGVRKMPSPSQFTVTVVIWSILQLITDARFGRAASASAWIVVAASLVNNGNTYLDTLQKVIDTVVKVNPSDNPTSTTPPSSQVSI